MQDLFSVLDTGLTEPETPKLYLFYLGGRIGGCNIEIHDVQFVIGTTPESCFSALKANWIGDRRRLHIDGYREVNCADGFAITLHDKPQESHWQLYFINVGAYRKGDLIELHQFDLFVDKNEHIAKTRALAKLLPKYHLQHKDDLAEVDDCMLLTKIGRYYIHLTPCTEDKNDPILFQGYLPI